MERRVVLAHNIEAEDLGRLAEHLKYKISSVGNRMVKSLEVKDNIHHKVLEIEFYKPWSLHVRVILERGLAEVEVYPKTRIGEYYVETVVEMITSHIREYDNLKGYGRINLILTDDMKFGDRRIARFREKVISRMFSGTLTYLVLSFMLIAILVVFFGPYAPILLVATHFTLLTFSDKLLLRISDWKISHKNRRVYILTIKVGKKDYDKFIEKMLPSINSIKRDMYESIVKRGQLDINVAAKILKEYGLDIYNSELSVRTIDLYGIVDSMSKEYGLKNTPRIGVLHTSLPNSAAVGLSPKYSSILVTSGIIALLDVEELKAVLAHELSHIKNRDAFYLSTIAAGEYLSRIYILYPALLPLWEAIPALGLGYVLIVFFTIIFLAKFAEARADIEASKITGNPAFLARALKKLGWRRLNLEEYRKFRAWVRVDPHPPLYFRVRRLESYRLEKVGLGWSAYISSARDCLREFFRVTPKF